MLGELAKDPRYTVRAEVAEALSLLWPDRDATLALLQNLANDRSADVARSDGARPHAHARTRERPRAHRSRERARALASFTRTARGRARASRARSRCWSAAPPSSSSREIEPAHARSADERDVGALPRGPARYRRVAEALLRDPDRGVRARAQSLLTRMRHLSDPSRVDVRDGRVSSLSMRSRSTTTTTETTRFGGPVVARVKLNEQADTNDPPWQGWALARDVSVPARGKPKGTEIMLDSNDHRAIAQRLDLFHFQEEAPGMVFWHPRGFTLYRLLEARGARSTSKARVTPRSARRRSCVSPSGRRAVTGSTFEPACSRSPTKISPPRSSR